MRQHVFWVEKCRPPTLALQRIATATQTPDVDLGPAFSLSNMYISLRHKRENSENASSLSLWCTPPGYWWFLSLRAIHIYSSIGASPCRFACDSLTILALIRAAAACVRGATGKHTHDRVPNWFRLSANQLCELGTFRLRDKLMASQWNWLRNFAFYKWKLTFWIPGRGLKNYY